MINIAGKIPFKIDSRTYELTNIVKSVILKRVNIDNTFLYEDFIIREDETLEQISYRVYGTVEYWHIIALVNNIVSPWEDLPMSNDMLVNYVTAKYGNPYELHWFVDNRTNRICDDRSSIEWRKIYDSDPNSLPEYVVPVDHITFESERNQKRTLIKIVNPNYVATFDEILKDVMNDN